jgi:hypothetical protein
MGLAALTDAVVAYLSASIVPAPALVGATYPTVTTDLPAVVVSFTGITEPMRGIGTVPAANLTGALAVTTNVDLTTPVATFPDEIVNLLSGDRLTLTLPHGPLVAADGTTTTFGAADVQATLGATTFEVVDAAPTPGQVRPDPNVGTLQFGAPLPSTGTLVVAYFIGEWEVQTERYQGVLLVETFGTDAPAVDVLSRAVETALVAPAGAPLAGLQRIVQTSWEPTEAASPSRAGARGRALGFGFDYELVEPNIGAGGGLISTVSVNSTLGAEHFDVQREGSST